MSNGADLPVLPSRVVPGDVVLQSWLVLLGVVPFDRHALALDSIDEGHCFVEESRTWLHRSWRHERHLTGSPGGRCLVADRLVITPRVGPARPVVARAVKVLFAHRHRRLVQRFGKGPAEVADAG